jgi:hypothetical protein
VQTIIEWISSGDVEVSLMKNVAQVMCFYASECLSDDDIMSASYLAKIKSSNA